MGVAVRTIAPLLTNKHADPAVVVCDVLGRWAVSLLSGHEGGANDLALAVANALDADPIITTTTEASKTLIVGLGCRRGTSADLIERAVQKALIAVGANLNQVRCLASVDLKAREAGLRQAARHLGLPLRIIGSERIRRCLHPLTPGSAAERHLGLPGVAEPSALLAGTRAKLILPRTTLEDCTVAIAHESPAEVRA